MVEDPRTKCKNCGNLHRVDEYRGMKFYECPESKRIYIVDKTPKQAGDKSDDTTQ